MKNWSRWIVVFVTVVFVQSYATVAIACDKTTSKCDEVPDECTVVVSTPNDAEGTAPLVFVANPECGSILAIEFGESTVVETVIETQGAGYEGIEFGPNGVLYISDPGRGLYSVDLDNAEPQEQLIAATIPGTFEPKKARFNSDGDLIVASKQGLKVFENLDPISMGIRLDTSYTTLPTYSLWHFVDVTTAANGDLLGLAVPVSESKNWGSGRVIRFPILPTGGYDDGISWNESFADPHAIARTSTGKVVVADGDTLRMFAANGTELEDPCWSFEGIVYGLEPSADDYLYATVAADVGGGVDYVKEGYYYEEATLNEIEFSPADSACEEPSPIATVNGIAGPPPMLYGVAVPFAKQDGEIIPDFPGGTQAFGFGEEVYEFRAIGDDGLPCTVTVSAHEVGADLLAELLTNSSIFEATPVVYEGENARAILFEYSEYPEPGSGCTGVEQILFAEHGINAYYSAFNPRVVLCHDDPQKSYALPFCELTNVLSISSLGFLPVDGRTGGRGTGRFSWSFLVDKAEFDANGDPVFEGTFCGPKPPLGQTTFDDPHVRKGGSTLPLKFAVSETTNCKKKPFVGDLTVILSVARIEDGIGIDIPFEDLVFTGRGSAEDYRAVFRAKKNPKQGYQLNLKLKYADGTPFEKGAVFELTFIDESGEYFQVQHAYVEIK